jgi:hypothetical protein
MLNCRQVTHLVSRSMDAKLRWHERISIRIHLLYCVWCRRYAAQLKFLRQATSQLSSARENASPEQLSNEAREQIRQRLLQALDEPPPPT